ncbi:NAD(P)-dependent alcohol dehydrogenase [Amycolatopsis acidicola]|uniref:alcohol dehydrogenase (NADP(+)) n=1 Tax=Amycolatopsis acidicola TaxID=2596893 RepID=A0A5N0VCM0_9PSEU|nr:NAD(P)-dependent alcohol dehydrogenase [Amycolatopsis acidicola]KAA9163318.1 NAD(P)-dependent alcohol dehydrogenase [Amycolatopsis acidicola]
MITVNARATTGPGEPFRPVTIERRDVGPRDVLIDIAYTGICHTDVHYASSPASRYPVVPGHEIAGTVVAVGGEVTRFAVGDQAGVGCMIGSCRDCDKCRAGLEQFCRQGYVRTYGSPGPDGVPTQGGYCEKIVVDEAFVLRIPPGLPLAEAAPLFCAGITMYSPLRHWKAGPGTRVGILGLGGLGHVGVRIAKALGAHTTVLDLAPGKREDGLRLGADEFYPTTQAATFKELDEAFDLLLSTVPASVDFNPFLDLLALDGTLVHLGAAPAPLSVSSASLRLNRRSIAGTRLGGIAETQEMIDFCARHRIGAEVEVIEAGGIDEAYNRVIAGDVRFRFVLDIETLA